jgi:DNA-3-methyladenine glycosylase
MQQFKPDFKKALPEAFYLRNTEEVAKDLLGKVIVFNKDFHTLCGEIVETEAYIPEGDEANHAARGMTKRNEMMFSKGGVIYIYLIYGMYYCINAVTEDEGVGSAVLIRALRPVAGIEKMQENRKKEKLKDLCSGPGKLAGAFGFSKADNGKSLTSPDLFIQDYKSYSPDEITADTRIGIQKSADLPLRFYPKDCEWRSK